VPWWTQKCAALLALAFIFVSDIKSLFLTFEHFISLFLFCFTAQKKKKKKFDPRGKEIIASKFPILIVNQCMIFMSYWEMLNIPSNYWSIINFVSKVFFISILPSNYFDFLTMASFRIN
jgi:hypothetical protein